ncbi:hypothetical protein SDC9_154950 [bioreactor metagenome]|uniref:Uncharacterized protein n=1 Tax=bioreactor metagenome TaxID=1076179 RepID=A0A645F2N3_9ZZZZ
MYKKIKIVNKYSKIYNKKIFRKKLYRLYSHLGAKSKEGHGNFLTYSYRAHDIFYSNNENRPYKVNIRNQVKNHWIYMYKNLDNINKE